MSIGSACRTRHQIARIQKMRNVEHKQPTLFFDWLMSGGLPGVIDILQRNFTLNPTDFSVDTMGRPENHIPLHKPSGFRFLHDLGCSAESRKNETAALESMHKNMDDFLSKYEYLGKRTDEYLRNIESIGLVYYGSMDHKKTEQLLRVLREKYNRDFKIIQVMEEGKHNPVNLPEITSLTVNNSSVLGTASEWMGADDSWDQAFNSIVLN
ncbi:hypothetical protein [Alcaligenes aquatilis]|uniref:hypothetical protein n=1 Tax=Alcaligenes aquatilis TaxID=323284 RepID=UPI003F8E245D